jgi:hypothetical protein
MNGGNGVSTILVACLAAGCAALAALVFSADTPPKPAHAATEILLAAGDIADCTPGAEETADLLDTLAGTIVTLGDNAYPDGSEEDFADCYEPTWGRHKARTWPSVGNHEYHTPGAAAYYAYFGAAAGDPAKGYYSFDLGDWHLIALNSNCGQVGGCGAGSPQEQWLRADLLANVADCTLAYMHHPRFSSANVHGNNAGMQPLWQALYDYGADIVLAGHDHTYERFAPQTPAGAADATNGIRQWVVGTGGRGHYGFGAPKPNSEERDGTSFGVLELTLDPSSYSWEFLPAGDDTYTDSGTTACHTGAPNDADYDGLLTAADNCPTAANPTQANTDDTYGNGAGIVGDDATVANGDALGDACDDDDDNDGTPDGSDADPGGDVTYDDDNDGDPAAGCLDGADAADDGPSWDTDCDGVRDGLAEACEDFTMPGDADGDLIPTHAEICKWGTSDNDTDSDGDGLSDCLEIVDVSGDGVADFLYDVLSYAQAALLPASSFGRDGDYDTNGDNTVDFLTDVLGAATLVLLSPAQGGCNPTPTAPNP